MKVTTAVIFASGGGTRMLPVTASVQKELLPILNRPVIDYLVSDLITAGITHIIFVIRPDSHGMQDYYTGNAALQRQLERLGKRSALADLEDIHQRATFSFVEQPENAGYGTAVPIKIALKHLPKNEAVFVAGGDDFVWHADGRSEAAELIDAFTASGAAGALTAMTAPATELHRYGVLANRREGEYEYLEQIVEKPKPGEAPSNLINISKYILGPQIWPYLKKVKPDPKSGELYITDAIQMAAADLPIVVHPTNGTYLDSGNTANWLKANLVVAGANPELAAVIRDYAAHL
ncbi:MAG TPA: sugar phosphate nucleotidyltransferase [Candidatus Saccharimonadia bacterium]